MIKNFFFLLPFGKLFCPTIKTLMKNIVSQSNNNNNQSNQNNSINEVNQSLSDNQDNPDNQSNQANSKILGRMSNLRYDTERNLS